MQYALKNNEKVEATPKSTAKCQLCDNEVFSKCGEVNIWHWSHKKHESCDGWYEPETAWHRNWKLVFGKENAEVVVKHDGVKHIADVLTSSNVVLELQNSPIQKPVIRRRENFYGERMIWILNGNSFKQNFSVFLNPILPSFLETTSGGVNFKTGELFNNLKVEQKRNGSFIWYWPRKSWSEAVRHVFIDFGGLELFWVKTGMGTNRGNGQYVKKEKFIRKYGGNLELINLVLD